MICLPTQPPSLEALNQMEPGLARTLSILVNHPKPPIKSNRLAKLYHLESVSLCPPLREFPLPSPNRPLSSDTRTTANPTKFLAFVTYFFASGREPCSVRLTGFANPRLFDWLVGP